MSGTFFRVNECFFSCHLWNESTCGVLCCAVLCYVVDEKSSYFSVDSCVGDCVPFGEAESS